MSVAHLSIGTATDRLNLLDSNTFGHVDWRPAAGDVGITFRESPLGDYRQPVASRELTTVETITFMLSGASQDAVIRSTQDLRRKLRAALNYWTQNWQDDVVYLKVQARCETNARYAVVVAATLPEDEDPFGPVFNQVSGGAVMADLPFIVERRSWLENVPGTGTAVELSSIATYNSITYGNVDDTETRDPTTAEGEVYLSNHWIECNLTNVHFWDSTGLAWSPNLIGAAHPHAFLPNPPVAGDFVIFGVDSSIADSGPFWSLVFDITTVLTGWVSVTAWRYSDVIDPTAWSGLTVQDNTNDDGLGTGIAFNTLGVKSVHWSLALVPVWAAVDPKVGANPALGVTGYWVGCFVTAVTGAGWPCRQNNRDYYTAGWSSVELLSDQAGGDFSMPGHLALRMQSEKISNRVNRIILGTRSVSRGADFNARINLADEQTPAGTTVTLVGASAWGSMRFSACGRYVDHPNLAVGWAGICDVTIDTTYGSQWRGDYLLFLRLAVSGFAGTPILQVRITISSGYASYTLPVIDASYLIPLTPAALEFGRITLPPMGLRNNADPFEVNFRIDAYGDGAVDVEFYELILIPVDEWASDLFGAEPLNVRWSEREVVGVKGLVVHVDSVTYPKQSHEDVMTEHTGGELRGAFTHRGPPLRFQTDEQQRCYFLALKQHPAEYRHWECEHNISASAQLWRNQRYLSMRGDR